jgi:hypothetical protein
VPTKTALKVGFLERDFECDHLAEKSNRTKMGKKNTLCTVIKPKIIIFVSWPLGNTYSTYYTTMIYFPEYTSAVYITENVFSFQI